jgi:hypothetical protein
MNDKIKRGLGDNSKNNSNYISMYEKNAVKEMMKEMGEFAKDAFKRICRVHKNIQKLTSGEDELSESQQNWNFNVDNYNKFVMQHDPNPKSNSRKLRKKYKPEKLTKRDLGEVAESINRDIDLAIEAVEDIGGTINAYKDPHTFKEWIDAEKSKEESNNE